MTNTRFAIASITKMFTAATVLRLAERGELSIDDGLGEWLPRSSDVEGITIRQVLSHTSGLGTEVDPDRHSSLLPHVCAPGTCLSYSNLGYELLGAVIEETTQRRRLVRAYREEIFDNLDLGSTFLPSQEDANGRMAVGHDATGILREADDEAGGDGCRRRWWTSMSQRASPVRTRAGQVGSAPPWSRAPGAARPGPRRGPSRVHQRLRYYPAYGVTVAAMVNVQDSSPGAQRVEAALASVALGHAPVIHPELGGGTCNTNVHAIRAKGTRLVRLTEGPALGQPSPSTAGIRWRTGSCRRISRSEKRDGMRSGRAREGRGDG